MRRRAEIEVSSELGAGAEAVWARAIDPAGINDELRPLMRMTVPRGVEDFGLDDPEPGQIGRSWMLLFGLLPFDYDDLNIVRLDPGRGFLERSSMLSMRLWEHERTLEPLDDGSLPDHRPGRLGAAPAAAGRLAASADPRHLQPPPPAATRAFGGDG